MSANNVAAQRSRALVKARKAARKAAEARRREEKRNAVRFARWVREEHAAYVRLQADPSEANRAAWITLWRTIPPAGRS